MATYAYGSNFTRPDWGDDAATDIHIETFENLLDSAFNYNSVFAALQTVKTANGSNNYRIDRMAGATVKARGAGDDVVAARLLDNKLNIIVEKMLYIRTAIDYADDWTSPDRMSDISHQHAIALAKQYDEEHILQIIKSRSFDATDIGDLDGFYDGIEITAEKTTDAKTYAANLLAAHDEGMQSLQERDVDVTNAITLVTPAVYSALMKSEYLSNVQYSRDNANIAMNRLAYINGTRIVSTPRFPSAAGTSTLGTTITAADATAGMCVFIPDTTLVTVEAQPMISKFWNDDRDMTNVLDTYAMYNIGQRRPDAAFTVLLEEVSE